MLDKLAVEGKGLNVVSLIECPFSINNSTEGSKRAFGMTARDVTLRLHPQDVITQFDYICKGHRHFMLHMTTYWQGPQCYTPWVYFLFLE